MTAPRVSVVLESVNESHAFGRLADRLEELRGQDYPADQVEVVVVANREQIERLAPSIADAPFNRLTTVAADTENYFDQKNRGLDAAQADVVAMLDADVTPGSSWLSAIVAGIDSGADVVAGLPLFCPRSGGSPDGALMLTCASVTWVPLLGVLHPHAGPSPPADGFQAHNVAFTAEVARSHRFRTDLENKAPGALLFGELRAASRRIVLRSDQRTAHHWSPGWWLLLHLRMGHETRILRATDTSRPHRWVERTGPAARLLTAGWRMLGDLRRWPAFAALAGVGRLRALGLLPLVVAVSAVARSTEVVGALTGRLAPGVMRRVVDAT